MKHINKAALAALIIGMFAAGSANADTLSASVDLVYDVQVTCTFEIADSELRGESFLLGGAYIVQQNAVASNLRVLCNNGVAYTIETDAAAGGLVNLVGATTAGVIPAYVFQGGQGTDGNGNIAYGTPFSTDANGEAISGVATGEQVIIPFSVAFNTDPSGATALPVPAADTYSATLNATLTY